MNAQASITSARSGSAEDRDDPGPSPSAAADEPPQEPPEPEIHLGGEAVHRVDLRWLRDHLALAVAELPAVVITVNVRLTDDATMTGLHLRHSGVDGTTDVLTFQETSPGEVPGAIEADIAVCVDEAERRGAQLGHSVERELLLYILHGLLHCAGHDDHDEAGYAAMHAEEDRILAAIGVGRTFATDHDVADEPVRRDRGRDG